LTGGGKFLLEKVGGEVKNRKHWGDIFLVANCPETLGTECDNSAYNSSIFFFSLCSVIILSPLLAGPYLRGEEVSEFKPSSVIFIANVTVLRTIIQKNVLLASLADYLFLHF